MRSRRILDRKKTHELKYLSACYFPSIIIASSRNYKQNVNSYFRLRKTWVWPRGEQWRPHVWWIKSLWRSETRRVFPRRCATELNFFNSGEDSPRFTSPQCTLLTLISDTILPSDKNSVSQSKTLVTLCIVIVSLTALKFSRLQSWPWSTTRQVATADVSATVLKWDVFFVGRLHGPPPWCGVCHWQPVSPPPVTLSKRFWIKSFFDGVAVK